MFWNAFNSSHHWLSFECKDIASLKLVKLGRSKCKPILEKGEKSQITNSSTSVTSVKSQEHIYLFVIQIQAWSLYLYHLSTLINLTHTGKDDGRPDVNRDNIRKQDLQNSNHPYRPVCFQIQASLFSISRLFHETGFSQFTYWAFKQNSNHVWVLQLRSSQVSNNCCTRKLFALLYFVVGLGFCFGFCLFNSMQASEQFEKRTLL